MAGPFRFHPRVFELDPRLELASALGRIDAHRLPFLLDSASGEPRRASVLAFDPLPPEEGDARLACSPRGLREILARLRPDGGDPVPGPFHGGLLCALAYDLGADGERRVTCPREPWAQPLFVGGLYTDFLVRDEVRGRTWLVLGEAPGDGRLPVSQRRAALERELREPRAPGPTRAESPRRSVTPAEHMRRIELLRQSIARGDLYQGNLAHRFESRAEGLPADWYARLRQANPAPYMGYVRWRASDGFEPAGALLSASPELFFEVQDGVARTRPIKGTIARARDAELDRRRAESLLASEKDKAELAMIVDLERNDLGRCAVPGSVRVEPWPRLETYARVHHLTADVVATLLPGRDAFDVLAALFPGGSITGAPKLAAMARIAELEGAGRGFFTGSLGYVDLRGNAAFNILIRTFLWRESGGGELSFQVGGGITWSSEAEAEERETLAKAAGMLEALGFAAEEAASPAAGNADLRGL
ncbi:MAG TPA: anthranilate synthase component I family protein [Planctomycetota bacterium]|nr:anthranilate synthase component I family protein [Planctomycetota bacterium]